MQINSIFGEVISKYGMIPDPHELKVLLEIPPPKTKKKLQAFLGIIDYLNKFSPSTECVCESLRQLTSSKTEWTWNATYQKLSDKAKSIIKEDACMKFYEEIHPLYLETDSSEVGLGAAQLQTRNGICCPRDKVPDNSILRPIAFVCKILPKIQ